MLKCCDYDIGVRLLGGVGLIKVAIVDDEYLIRERVKKCIDWNQLGFEIVGEASNGQEALLLLQNQSPQIVITDISMPHADGIVLSEHIQRSFPRVKVIILTGYSRFDYARGALNAGVSHYLLKPVIPEELIQVLETLRLQIDREKQAERFTEMLKKEANRDLEKKKTKLYKQLISGGHITREIKKSAALVFKDFIFSDLLTIFIEFNGKPNAWIQSEDLDLWSFAISNIFGEVFEKTLHSFCSDGHESRVILLVGADDGDFAAVCEKMCRRAREYVQKYLQIHLTISISNVHKGPVGISKSYEEALSAMRNKLILGSGRIIRYDTLKTGAGRVGVDGNIRSSLLIGMRLCDTKSIHEEIEGVFDAVLKNPITYDDFQLILSEILLAIVNFTHEKGLDLPAVTGRPLTVAYLTNGNMDMGDIKAYLFEAINSVIRHYERDYLLGYSSLITKTKKFIEANYSNKQVSLEIIASNMGISSSYLSSLFKKESGHSIVEYLTHCRMTVAKKLLDEGGKTLAEVADMVGFNDPYYFSKCFKKSFGQSPSHYVKDNK